MFTLDDLKEYLEQRDAADTTVATTELHIIGEANRFF